MKILTAQQIKTLETETLKVQNRTELDLIESAGAKVAHKILNRFDNSIFYIFCGNGNNGADGLVCARELANKDKECQVYITNTSDSINPNLQVILEGIDKSKVNINFISNDSDIPDIPQDVLIVDALLGTGVNKAVTGVMSLVISKINAAGQRVVSIDLPSGLPAEGLPYSNTIVESTITYTFELPKLNLLLPECEKFVNLWEIIKLKLDKHFLKSIGTRYQFLTKRKAALIMRKLNRSKFSHKGTFGHTLVIAGSKGKIGASILTAKSVLRSGGGLVTSHLPEIGHVPMQTALPEAIVMTDLNSDFTTGITADPHQYQSYAIGPGLGTAKETESALVKFLQNTVLPVVLDADALNLISNNLSYVESLPKRSVLTPHHKEFERLVGESANSYGSLEKQINFSSRYGQIVVLKGAHTRIALPDGSILFNSTGNPGLATAGSGDVLTGIIAGLISQGLSSDDSAVLGVYLHGLAGDLAKEEKGEQSIIASDIIENLGKAMGKLAKI